MFCANCGIEIHKPRRKYCSSKCVDEHSGERKKLPYSRHMIVLPDEKNKIGYCIICDKYVGIYQKDHGGWVCAASQRERIWRSNGINLTVKEFDSMIMNQCGRCAICEDDMGPNPCVDHCHETYKIRDLLCNNCNLGLGHFSENVDRLTKAILYIERHSESSDDEKQATADIPIMLR